MSVDRLHSLDELLELRDTVDARVLAAAPPKGPRAAMEDRESWMLVLRSVFPRLTEEPGS